MGNLVYLYRFNTAGAIEQTVGRHKTSWVQIEKPRGTHTNHQSAPGGECREGTNKNPRTARREGGPCGGEPGWDQTRPRRWQASATRLMAIM
jgi:hypothetical protein